MASSTVEQTKLEIVPLNGITAAQLYAEPETLSGILERVKTEALSHQSDVTTAKGRSAIASVAFKVTRSKTFLDELGKELMSDLKAKVAVVDGERRRVRDELDKLRDEVRRPLDEWDEAEEARKNAHEDALEGLKDLWFVSGLTEEQLNANLAKAEERLTGRDWQEYEANATQLATEIRQRVRNELAMIAREAEIAKERQRLLDELNAEREKERKQLQAEREKLEAEKARLREQAAEIERQKAALAPPILPDSEPVREPEPVAATIEPVARINGHAFTPPVTASTTKAKFNNLNEPTFLEMAHALKALIRILNNFQLDTEQSETVAKAIELHQRAMAEPDQSGRTTK